MKHTILFALLLSPFAMLDAAEKKPNIVYIMADDVGWGDLSVHGGGVPTPNIARLFKQGVELTRFMGWCVCSPTRAMLLTGRHPIRVGTAPEVGGELAKEETTIAEGNEDVVKSLASKMDTWSASLGVALSHQPAPAEHHAVAAPEGEVLAVTVTITDKAKPADRLAVSIANWSGTHYATDWIEFDIAFPPGTPTRHPWVSPLEGNNQKPFAIALLTTTVASLRHAAPIPIEAESFNSRTHAEKRKWHVFSAQSSPQVSPDGDPPHLKGASVPMQLWLDVEKPGEHELLMSMREDGIEVDQLVLTTDVNWRPDGYIERADSVAATTPAPDLMQPRKPDGDGSVTIGGELKQWHKVTLTLDGPFAHEGDNEPNPFTDCAFNVTFTHESGSPKYTVPGYFAADGDAANSSSKSGTKWRAHLSPDKPGKWRYSMSFAKGKEAALGGAGTPAKPFDGQTGDFIIATSDKAGRDFRAHGRLQYVGKHHLRFAGSQSYFLKAGPDSPETMLAFADFDDTIAPKKNAPIKTWEPHLGDWKPGDPTWRGDKGKGLVGALNYLADKGVNAFSFLTYNTSGDGDNVWPFVGRNDKLHYDCSKLDQWGIVFDHATTVGLYLHFKIQENEIDDNRIGDRRNKGKVPASLDGGELGVERKLYCRELIARFGHALALNWNIGEENTQSSDEVRGMVKFLHDTDPYRHHIVIHTFPPQQEEVYRPLLGDKSLLTGASLQNPWNTTHQRALQWLRESAAAGRPWVVASDEQNPAGLGVPPDPGYNGHDGVAVEKQPEGSRAGGHFTARPYTMHDIRKLCLWGSLMAGGAGVEYYFGYSLPENDLNAQDLRSRDKSWDYCRIALDFFHKEGIPFAEMTNANALIDNPKNANSRFCFAKSGEVYLVYLPTGGTTNIDLSAAQGTFTVKWFNPRTGGALADGSVISVDGGKAATLGNPPTDSAEDWLVVIRR